MRFWLATLMLLLAGCESSRFTSLPWADGAQPCVDPPVGWWVSTDPDDAKDRVWVRIDADCSLVLAGDERRPDGALDVDVHRLAGLYGPVDGRIVLAVPDRAVAAIDRDLADRDVAPTATVRAGAEWHLMHVTANDDTLRVDFVDHRELAHRIIEDEIAGSVSKSGGTLANVVTEDSGRLRELIAARHLFGRHDSMWFDRVADGEVPAEVVSRVRTAGVADR
jgi:hypothetical protein